jgi:hypothetical protein
LLLFLSFLLSIAIYRLQVATFLMHASVSGNMSPPNNPVSQRNNPLWLPLAATTAAAALA